VFFPLSALSSRTSFLPLQLKCSFAPAHHTPMKVHISLTGQSSLQPIPLSSAADIANNTTHCFHPMPYGFAYWRSQIAVAVPASSLVPPVSSNRNLAMPSRSFASKAACPSGAAGPFAPPWTTRPLCLSWACTEDNGTSCLLYLAYYLQWYMLHFWYMSIPYLVYLV
jgi:hypothetical protein